VIGEHPGLLGRGQIDPRIAKSRRTIDRNRVSFSLRLRSPRVSTLPLGTSTSSEVA